LIARSTYQKWAVVVAILAAILGSCADPLRKCVATEEQPSPTTSPSPDTSRSPVPPSNAGDSKPGSTPKADVQYLPGPNGELVPVPIGASLLEYLEWLKDRGGNARQRPPAYGVASVELEGDADGDSARLRARVRIQVNQQAGWVRVPLRFDEAVLQSIEHSGPGGALHEVSDSSTGHDWWLQGAGMHVLDLRCDVPLRRQGQSQRLQLQLPLSAVGTLKLRVPNSQATTKVPERVVVRSRSVEAQPGGRKLTEFDVSGFGARLDFAWESSAVLSQNDAMLEVSNSFFASVADGQTVTAEVTQRVQALQGSFEELRVRLPGGCELLRLDSIDVDNYRAAPDDAAIIVVKFKRFLAGPTELRWTVRTKIDPGESQFVLDGFEVERARIQTGQIAVGLVGDYRLSKSSVDDRFVQRINPSDLAPALRRGDVASAYRILNQPFRLSLAVEKLEPLVSVEPCHFVMPAAEQLEIEHAFGLNIRRGSVSEVVLRCPGKMGDGWSVVRVEPAARVEPIADLADAETTTHLVRLRFLEPLRGATELRVVTRQSWSETITTGDATLSLPLIDAAYNTPAMLLVPMAASLDVISDKTGIAEVSEVADATDLQVELPSNWPQGPALAVRLAAGIHQVALRPIDQRVAEPTPRAGNGRRIASRKHGAAAALIGRSLIRTEFTLDGASRSTVNCRITGAPTRLAIHLPRNTTPVRFAWNGQPIQPAQLIDTATERRVELDLSRVSDVRDAGARKPRAEHHLIFEVQSDSDGPSHFVTSHRLPAFLFGPDVVVRDVLWEVVLPSNWHLFSEPFGLSPLFRWQRSGVFWTREAAATKDELIRWLSDERNVPDSRFDSGGNRYLFRRLGDVREGDMELAFSSMSQSAIVLIGAGLALVLGLVLIKVPGTRNVLTVLVIAVLVSGLGLWQSSPILVLLQPAGLGVLLAVTAAVLDGWVKRRRHARGLTISSPSGFVNSPSSIERQRAIGVGSNDFTALCADPGAMVQPVTTSEAGTRP